jgi:hypothetical protein
MNSINRLALRFLFLITLVGVGFLAANVREADAQVTVGGVVGLSTQPTGEGREPYLGPGFGGTSFSTVIFIDGGETPRITLGGEVSLAADISGSQTQRADGGFYGWLSEHHDSIYSAVVKVHSRAPNRVNIAGGGGASLAHRVTTRTGTFNPCCFTPVETPASQELSNVVLGFNAGVDGVVSTGNRIGIVGLFRFYYLLDDDKVPSGPPRRGVSSLIFRYGAGVQVRF